MQYMKKVTRKYNHKEIEEKQNRMWKKLEIYKTEDNTDKPKYYILDMFPYPSGVGLHVGHPKGYIATDVFARMMRMRRFNVLHPMGWDAFGLPAENYALKNKVHPAVLTEKNVEVFKKQLGKLGLSYDWDREINTTDPNYYKWTQWIFLQLFNKGLAYESYEPINWCPTCKTGLSNEDLEGGLCERCGSKVEQKPMRQWMLKITDYADRLLDDLDKLPEWEASIKEMQRNWIGRKEGINIEYKVVDSKQTITCFTTRPDTNFGATFVVLGPEHPLVEKITTDEQMNNVMKYIKEAGDKTEIERLAEGREKSGVFTGAYCVNDLNGSKMPVWVSDYVLGHVGTGAVIGVPGHDKRDFGFAQKYNLPIMRVVVGPDGDKSEITELSQVQEDAGTMVNSDFLNGMDIIKATEEISRFLVEKKWGEKVVEYKLRDWVFSRQRYWGEPIPIVHCKKCGVQGVPEKDLPVLLPKVDEYEPTGTGESPLVKIKDWVETECPKCGGKAERETNTMPQWAGSSWYYLRYIDPNNANALVDRDKEKYWSPVDFYVGGADHATRHLIYARFWHKFLFDIGVVSYDEPFTRLQHVGLILAEDGRKMSKRWGNVINPNVIVEEFGADAMRVYEMFIGPFNQPAAWNSKGLVGIRKFLEKVWVMQNMIVDQLDVEQKREIESSLHKMIKKVSEDIEEFKFNTAVSAMMVFVNTVRNVGGIEIGDYLSFVKVLSVFAPYLTEEIWQRHAVSDNNGESDKKAILWENWPKWDENKITSDEVVIVIQVNGKKRAEISVGAHEANDRDLVLDKIYENEKVMKIKESEKIKKEIFVPGRLVNLVV
jgi:leucyl-tRNA synthetase